MTDIDFDELDKAVNSVINGQSAALPSNPVGQTPASPAGSAAPNPQPRRSGGRFMDVVPPAANTRVNVTVPERVSRQGASVAPIDNTGLTPVEPAVAAPAPVPPTVPNTNPTSEWPDPLDFHNANNPSDAQPEATDPTPEDADIDQIADDINQTLSQTSSELPDTPFLSGVKVEKRPLGGPTAEDSPVVTEPEQNAMNDMSGQTMTEPETEVNTVPTEPYNVADTMQVTELPEETQLVGVSDVESTEQKQTPAETFEATQPPVQSETAAQPQQPAAPTVSENAPQSVTATPASQPMVATSIAQQYQEAPSSGDQTTGAIYDTNAYHKGVLKPVKTKSSWWLVIWIIALLVIGTGAGAAVYFFLMPNL